MADRRRRPGGPRDLRLSDGGTARHSPAATGPEGARKTGLRPHSHGHLDGLLRHDQRALPEGLRMDAPVSDLPGGPRSSRGGVEGGGLSTPSLTPGAPRPVVSQNEKNQSPDEDGGEGKQCGDRVIRVPLPGKAYHDTRETAPGDRRRVTQQE